MNKEEDMPVPYIVGLSAITTLYNVDTKEKEVLNVTDGSLDALLEEADPRQTVKQVIELMLSNAVSADKSKVESVRYAINPPSRTGARVEGTKYTINGAVAAENELISKHFVPQQVVIDGEPQNCMKAHIQITTRYIMGRKD